jgi:hypothetical protein
MGGSDAVTELQRFLEEYDAMKRSWTAKGMLDLQLDFFDNREQFSSKVDIMILMYVFQPSLNYLLDQNPLRCSLLDLCPL